MQIELLSYDRELHVQFVHIHVANIVTVAVLKDQTKIDMQLIHALRLLTVCNDKMVWH